MTMRKIFYMPFLLALIFLNSCSKSELMPYSAGDMVYFYKSTYGSIIKDSLTYSFAVHDEETAYDTVFIPFRIMGKAADHDRTVSFMADESKTNMPAVNYLLLPAVIKANTYTGLLPIKVIKSPELKNKEYRLWVKIISSKDFQPGVSNQVTFLLKLNNFLSKPASWSDYVFGKYSAVKYSLVIKATGRSEFANLSNPEEKFLTQQCRNALYDYENENGILYDENGEAVSFP